MKFMYVIFLEYKTVQDTTINELRETTYNNIKIY